MEEPLRLGDPETDEGADWREIVETLCGCLAIPRKLE